MSETGNKAVFLSYASQDATAALRICDALRAAGVEVWFDQSELRGGDTWDHKIRKQIKECALFVPIISAHTNSRPEGYFRLEWKLAVDRSHLLADDHAFLFPVVIDDTPEATARVPEKFRDVQWTRLSVKDTPETLARRVGRLLDRGEMEAGRPRPAERGSAFAKATADKEDAASPRKGRQPSWLRYAWAGVGLMFAVVYAVRPIMREMRRADTNPGPAATAVPVPLDVAAPASEARQLAARAQELFLGLDSTKDDFALAEDLLRQAVAKAPSDAEVWAVYAQLNDRYRARGWDFSEERREAARAAIQRALRLDPKSFQARYAAATFVSGAPKEIQEHEKSLRALLQERPDDKRVLRALAALLRNVPGHQDEVIQLYDRSAQLPGGDPLALYNKALALWFVGRSKEAQVALTASLAQQPFVGSRLLDAFFALSVNGDLDRAQSLLAQLPASVFGEDRGCYFGYLVHRYRNEPDQALSTVQAFSRDWLNDNWFRGPRGELVGNALAQAGRPDAAAVEWRTALKVVDHRLAANPNDPVALGKRVMLLGKLGDTAAARQLLPAVRQLLQVDQSDILPPTWFAEACLVAGDRKEAMRLIDVTLDSKLHATFFTASDLRHDPTWTSLRDDPEFVRLIAKAERVERADNGESENSAPVPPASVDQKSVAVLAFSNLSEDKTNEYFSDGISEELLTVLQKIPGLHVAARTSSFYFKGKEATAQEIGTKLGVANLVEGSVQKSGSRVKVTVHLSRAATGEELWSQSYTRELKDVFALQEELALAIVGELRGQLGGAANAAAAVKAAVKGGTTNAEAFQQYLQGRFYANRHAEKPTDEAIGYFQRAVDLDPSFALAWAGLAETHVWLCEFSDVLDRKGFDLHQGLARTAVDRALALEPKLPEGLLARALIQLNIDFDWKGAAETLRTAQALAPADPAIVTNLGNLAGALGNNAESIAQYRHSVELDPVNPVARSFLAFAYVTTGQFAEAEAEYTRLAELNPTAPWAYAGLGLAYVLQGKFEQATVTAQKDAAEWARLLITAIARFGEKRLPEADAALAQLTAKYEGTAAYQIAEVHAYRGDRDRAFEWLERAFQQRDGGLLGCQSDPLLANLRSDPRFTAFLRKLGLAPDQLK